MLQKKNQAKKVLSKKELVFSIMTILFDNRTYFYQMHVKDQRWLIENPREGFHLITNAIELRVPLKKAMQDFGVDIPTHIDNNKVHVGSMLGQMENCQNIFLGLGENDLNWMKNGKTKQLISFIIQIIHNREKVANWIDRYHYIANENVAIGDFYISDIGHHYLNRIETDLDTKGHGWIRIFYVTGKNEARSNGIAHFWDCISIQYPNQGQKPPMRDPGMYRMAMGVKLTPRVEQKLSQAGIFIDKDYLKSFADKIDTLDVIDRSCY